MTPDNFTSTVAPRVLANKKFNKIFCIGYNKTGTTTLEAILRIYGYSLPNQQDQEIRLSKNVFETNYTEFINFSSRYDAFQDMPFSRGLTFVAADALFPNSKFILSLRNSEDWYKSMISFYAKKYGVDPLNMTELELYEKLNYLYKGYKYNVEKQFLTTFSGDGRIVDWSKLFDKKYYIEQYEERNLMIKKYFMNASEKLLVIDITKEKTTQKICEFLNIPKEFSIKMPHKNKT